MSGGALWRGHFCLPRLDSSITCFLGGYLAIGTRSPTSMIGGASWRGHFCLPRLDPSGRVFLGWLPRRRRHAFAQQHIRRRVVARTLLSAAPRLLGARLIERPGRIQSCIRVMRPCAGYSACPIPNWNRQYAATICAVKDAEEPWIYGSGRRWVPSPCCRENVPNPNRM